MASICCEYAALYILRGVHNKMTTKIAFVGAKDIPKAPYIYKIFGQRPIDNYNIFQFYRATRIYDFKMYHINIQECSGVKECSMMILNEQHDIVVLCFDVNTNLNDVRFLATYLSQSYYNPHLVIMGIIIKGRRVHPLALHTLQNKLEKQHRFQSVHVLEEFQYSSARLHNVLKNLIIKCNKSRSRY